MRFFLCTVYLDLNIVKTKEMVVDFRKKNPPVPELIIDDVAVERVAEYKLPTKS